MTNLAASNFCCVCREFLEPKELVYSFMHRPFLVPADGLHVLASCSKHKHRSIAHQIFIDLVTVLRCETSVYFHSLLSQDDASKKESELKMSLRRATLNRAIELAHGQWMSEYATVANVEGLSPFSKAAKKRRYEEKYGKPIPLELFVNEGGYFVPKWASYFSHAKTTAK